MGCRQSIAPHPTGLLLAARDADTIVSVALAVYTPSAKLGRVMTLNNFFVRSDYLAERSEKRTGETFDGRVQTDEDR